MKRKAFAAIAVILVLVGLTMLIVPRISNRVGEQIAHTTIEDFKALKSKATSDEPTEKNAKRWLRRSFIQPELCVLL